MTVKLVKYEFHSIIKLMGIVWIALPAMAVIMAMFDVLNFSGRAADSPFMVDALKGITGFLYVAIFIALVVVTLLLVIVRFYKGLLRDEGYLMHTLPVKTWQLITAKGIAAVLVEIISTVVAVISILILGLSAGSLSGFWEFLKELAEAFTQQPAFIGIGLEVLILLIVMAAASNYRLYAAMAVGQLAGRHKIALSVAAYLGIGVVLMLAVSLLGTIFSTDLFSGVFEVIADWTKGMEPTGIASAVLAVGILSQVFLTVLFHILTEQILRRRLNLE